MAGVDDDGGVDLRIPGIGPGILVGRGGYAEVYRATQLSSGGVVAVKVLSGHLDETARSRFERETAALGALRGHPNICTVFDAGADAVGRPYLVMEYAPRTLADLVKSAGPLSWQDAAELGVKLAGALETAHRAGLLHRDVKPENVLITGFGEPQLADFGLARFHDDTASRGGITTTLSHAAPELLGGNPPSARSDVYALGSTLFYALMGRAAFALSDEAHLVSLYKRIEQDPVPPMPGVPPELAEVVRSAMAKVPDERFATAESVGEALRAAQEAHGLAMTRLPLPLGAVDQARDIIDRDRTVDDGTPRVDEHDVDGITRPVERRDRVVPVDTGGDAIGDTASDQGARLRGRFPYLMGGGVLLLVLVVALALLLAGGGGDGERADAGDTTEPSRPDDTSSEPGAPSDFDPSGNWVADLTDAWLPSLLFNIECAAECTLHMFPGMGDGPPDGYEPAPLTLEDGAYTASGNVPFRHALTCGDEYAATRYEFSLFPPDDATTGGGRSMRSVRQDAADDGPSGYFTLLMVVPRAGCDAPVEDGHTFFPTRQ